MPGPAVEVWGRLTRLLRKYLRNKNTSYTCETIFSTTLPISTHPLRTPASTIASTSLGSSKKLPWHPYAKQERLRSAENQLSIAAEHRSHKQLTAG